MALLVAPSVALAAPHTMTHQGRLFDSSGTPLESTHSIEFALYDAPAGGSWFWSEAHTLTLENGYFSVVLGDSEPLEPEALAGDDGHWLEVTVDGTALPTRVPLTSVPYALQAGIALSLAEGSTVDAASIVANGDAVFDADGKLDYERLVNVPDASDTLGDLVCSSGQSVTYNGSSWACADNTFDASAIVGGTLDAARLPIGDQASEIAAGNHTHAQLHDRYADSEAKAVADSVVGAHASTSDAHHAAYTDDDAQDVVDAHAADADAHHAPYTDEDARAAGRNYCYVHSQSGHDLYSASWTNLNGLATCKITSTGRPLKVTMDFSVYGIHHGGIRLYDGDGTIYGTQGTYGFDWVAPAPNNEWIKRNIMRVIDVPEGDHSFTVQIRSQGNGSRFYIHPGSTSEDYSGFHLLIEEL